MRTFYLTDTGKIRDHNEDNLVILHNASNEYLLAVADGMGGHKAGEVASSIAVEYLKEKFNSNYTIGTKEEAISWIRKSATEINDNIFKYTYEHAESKGMGTTLVVAIYTKDYLLFGNIGDSSGFVFKDNKLFKVTRDHTLVNLLISTGELSEEDAKFHPKKNVLMKALGAVNPVEVDIFDVETDVDGILLSSDGLTNMLNVDQIENVLKMDLSIEEKARKLIMKSNNRGGTDNISVAILDRESGTNDN
ncbi:MAG: Stp1/IreP family PP2C-type Ser/Thr phosphatase [Bacilli bacterium]|nr:Stp1/IreP family PP2C-type Ser/Thr phosphatase [Bacilli bacterium]MBQ6282129.1 Stp1/IreP family PP2C-type Ser/Thr phosphatase [Bacilli bacterium]